jgi:hypothetical protein
MNFRKLFDLERMFHSTLNIHDTDKVKSEKQFFNSFQDINSSSKSDTIDQKYFEPSSPMTLMISELDEKLTECEKKLMESEKAYLENASKSSEYHELVFNDMRQKCLLIANLENEKSNLNSRLVKEFIENRALREDIQHLNEIVSLLRV